MQVLIKHDTWKTGLPCIVSVNSGIIGKKEDPDIIPIIFHLSLLLGEVHLYRQHEARPLQTERGSSRCEDRASRLQGCLKPL